jgi:hypothetical protein
LEQLQRDYEPYKAQDDLNLIMDIFPKMAENLRIARLCRGIGLTVEAIKRLFNGETITVTGKLFSPEHDRNFDVKEAELRLSKEPDDPKKLRLSINGQNIIDWFREQFNKLKQVIRPYIRPTIIQPQQGKGRGIG